VIILDTNVLSELLRPAPDARVLQWLTNQPRASIFTTTITRGEVLYGIGALPAGKRSDGLWSAATEIFDIEFEGRVIGFDSAAADDFAEIAAIARSRGADLATRNVADFEHCGITVINPWG